MEPLPFLNAKPKQLWENCVAREEEWKRNWKSTDCAGWAKEFRRNQTLKLVLINNVLEDTLNEVNLDDASQLLKKVYDECHRYGKQPSRDDFEVDGEWHLVQYLMAYEYLFTFLLSDSSLPLTEEQICATHKIMMEGRQLEDEERLVTAGSYRNTPVHAGRHQYPDHEEIPSSMSKIVSMYNEQFSQPHDPYQLAAWLYFRVISLHPFEDGNGRLCRLLWCWSLMRDEIPFPLILSSSHRKAQKHVVWCIVKGREKLTSNSCAYLTTLTVWSVYQTWKEFFIQ